MILKWIFDRVVALIGLLFLWPVLLVVAILVKVKMPGGPALFVQKRVDDRRDGPRFARLALGYACPVVASVHSLAELKP